MSDARVDRDHKIKRGNDTSRIREIGKELSSHHEIAKPTQRRIVVGSHLRLQADERHITIEQRTQQLRCD